MRHTPLNNKLVTPLLLEQMQNFNRRQNRDSMSACPVHIGARFGVTGRGFLLLQDARVLWAAMWASRKGQKLCTGETKILELCLV